MMILCMALGVVVQVEQARIDEAIRKGVAYLQDPEAAPPPSNAHGNYDELVLWTYVHAGVPQTEQK